MADEKHNASDLDQVRKAEKEVSNERKQVLADLRDILSTPAGVRYFTNIISEGRIFSSSFTGNSQTFFYEGWRSLALSILGDITEAAPDKVVEILINDKEKEK
jgi:hypothetical protein